MTKKHTKQLVLSALLVALGILIPMIMPVKIIVGPYTATLASHVPVLLACFISPVSAAAVTIGTALGFFLSFPFIVALRALSHIFFAMFLAFIFLKFSKDKVKNVVIFGIVAGIIHAVFEVLVLILFGTNIENSGFIMPLTAWGTFLHHLVDLAIAYFLYKTLKVAKVWNFD